MTICVSVKVQDCIVFAADSATSLVDGSRTNNIENVYIYGNKVFNLKKGLPIAAMTCGMGNMGPVSISALTKDLRLKFCSDDPAWKVDSNTYSMQDVAEKAKRFFFDEIYQNLAHKPQGDHEFEFWIGGNGSNETHGEIWKITIRNGQCLPLELVADKHDFKISFAGQPEAINRLVNGYSQHLGRALIDTGLDPKDLDSILTHIERYTFASLAAPAMPVQDAIDLADFLVDTTKKFVRFMPGADVVGGDTDICVVTKHEGFKWIKRKHHFNAALNPDGI